MFNRILVCVDGSCCAAAAARAARAIADRYGAEFLALNVFYPALAEPGEIGAWAIAIDQRALDLCASEELEAAKKSIAPTLTDGQNRTRFVQEIGHPVETILRVAQQESVDLVVVGSRGLQGVKELFLGSVSSAIMHHARCAVLIVRGRDVPPPRDAFQRIVLASDGSARARRAGAVAIEMAQKFATTLTVLNVAIDLSSVSLPEDEETLVGDLAPEVIARRQLDLVRQNLGGMAKEAGVNCSYVQKQGHPYEVIVRFAEQHDADLVVVGSRGLGGFEQMLVGSVSNYVAHHSPCPVLVVH